MKIIRNEIDPYTKKPKPDKIDDKKIPYNYTLSPNSKSTIVKLITQNKNEASRKSMNFINRNSSVDGREPLKSSEIKLKQDRRSTKLSEGQSTDRGLEAMKSSEIISMDIGKESLKLSELKSKQQDKDSKKLNENKNDMDIEVNNKKPQVNEKISNY